ncbi:TetR/AcrR family transcriptional regulator [Promicromonospora sukumoe]|uniref:TetR/AcrR family transcriptional regulator n=1 Tax=Promicromonospora sukumoe TaxID=88382 RepID=UPI0004784950|nr:TetR/AcrR family transcriptional regulator [Promicromonospora sukumoe]
MQDWSVPAATPTRRQRLRAELLHEARAAARRLLAEHGADGVTMVAVAKEVGIAGPGMYRYFEGRPGLLTAVYDDTLDELIAYLEQAVARQPADDQAARLHAATHALFVWCRTHRNEFDLLLGADAQHAVGQSGTSRPHFVHRLGSVFVPTFAALWRAGVPFPADADVAPGLAPELDTYRAVLTQDSPGVAEEVPVGVVHTIMVFWRQVYGLLCMVAYDQLDYAFGNFDAMFDDMMRSLLASLGLEPSPRVVLVEA